MAVDADIELIEEGKSSFKEYIDNGRLILLNYAITNESDKDINFFISQNTLWNSTNGAVASRQGNKTLKKRFGQNGWMTYSENMECLFIAK